MFKRFTFLLVLVALSGSSSVWAFGKHPAAPSAPPSKEVVAFCQQISQIQAEIPKTNFFSTIWDLIRLSFFPGTLVQLHETAIAVSDSNRVRVGNSSDDNLEAEGNLIFSIDPPQDLMTSGRIEKLKQRFDEVDKELGSLTPQLRDIVAAHSVDDCIQRAEGSQFDFDRFTRLAEEKKSLQIVRQLKEAKMIDQIIESSLSHLHLRWQIIHTTDLMAVHEALRDPMVRNVVIIGHGTSDGKIFDSRLSQYPLTFFDDISPNVQSVAIYACHGEEIAQFYGIEASLKKLPSFYGNRKLFVSDGTRLSGMDELVPVQAFTEFMEKLDNSLNQVPAGQAKGPLYEWPMLCQMGVTGFEISKGTFGFTLNGHYLGAANVGGDEFSFRYPCSFADRKKNILTIHGLSAFEEADLTGTGFQIVPETEGEKFSNPSLTHYKRDNGTYQGSKFEFEKVGP
jgi:hypothetical protein